MPKLDTLGVTIKGEFTPLEIWWSKSNEFYVKNMPINVRSVLNKNFIGYTNMNDIKKDIYESLVLYHEKTKLQRKVIAYTLELSRLLYMNEIEAIGVSSHFSGYQDWVPNDPKINRRIENLSHSIGFEYIILIEIDGKEKEYYELKEDGSLGFKRSNHDYDSYYMIDWTQEREQAFCDICNAMKELAKKMGTILLDQNKTINLIDTGIKLLK